MEAEHGSICVILILVIRTPLLEQSVPRCPINIDIVSCILHRQSPITIIKIKILKSLSSLYGLVVLDLVQLSLFYNFTQAIIEVLLRKRWGLLSFSNIIVLIFLVAVFGVSFIALLHLHQPILLFLYQIKLKIRN